MPYPRALSIDDEQVGWFAAGLFLSLADGLLMCVCLLSQLTRFAPSDPAGDVTTGPYPPPGDPVYLWRWAVFGVLAVLAALVVTWTLRVSPRTRITALLLAMAATLPLIVQWAA